MRSAVWKMETAVVGKWGFASLVNEDCGSWAKQMQSVENEECGRKCRVWKK